VDSVYRWTKKKEGKEKEKKKKRKEKKRKEKGKKNKKEEKRQSNVSATIHITSRTSRPTPHPTTPNPTSQLTLVLSDLTKSDGTRLVPVWLLDTTGSRCCGLASGWGGRDECGVYSVEYGRETNKFDQDMCGRWKMARWCARVGWMATATAERMEGRREDNKNMEATVTGQHAVVSHKMAGVESTKR
jgi:hypothetical protein